jgi:hypothetical protein
MCRGRNRLLQMSAAGSGRIRRARPPLGNGRHSSLERWGARRNWEDHLSAARLVLRPNNNSVGFLNVVQRA